MPSLTLSPQQQILNAIKSHIEEFKQNNNEVPSGMQLMLDQIDYGLTPTGCASGATGTITFRPATRTEKLDRVFNIARTKRNDPFVYNIGFGSFTLFQQRRSEATMGAYKEIYRLAGGTECHTIQMSPIRT